MQLLLTRGLCDVPTRPDILEVLRQGLGIKDSGKLSVIWGNFHNAAFIRTVQSLIVRVDLPQPAPNQIRKICVCFSPAFHFFRLERVIDCLLFGTGFIINLLRRWAVISSLLMKAAKRRLHERYLFEH
jgi:hypothetical protein